ncbi:MAG: hypothetical protein LBB41_03050 [Prevotellaceae bacterium]|jgi:hypothetical protein|nr:hypothetical protein [Prevotellaceae bacterium]
MLIKNRISRSASVVSQPLKIAVKAVHWLPVEKEKRCSFSLADIKTLNYVVYRIITVQF